MIKSMLTPMTDEDRIKAALIKEEKKEWARENLKQEFEDLSSWKDLSSKYGVRLPVYYVPGTEVKFIKRMAKKRGVDINEFVEATGYSSLKDFALANITWPCYALCGVFLEWLDEVYGEKI